MSALLKRLLKDRDKGYLFNALDRHKLKKQEQKRQKHKWEGKVYPSSLSFDMCVAEYFEKIENFVEFGLDALNTMSDGTYKHNEIQDEALEIPGLLFKDPTYPSQELFDKAQTMRPEVPVYDPRTKMSGRADVILEVKGLPVPVDIKTCSVDPNTWTKGDWQKTVPLDKHICQVCVYGHIMIEQNYWPETLPEEGGLAYINKLMKPGIPGSRREHYFLLADYRAQTVNLFDEVARHMEAKLVKSVAPCTSKFCKKHSN